MVQGSKVLFYNERKKKSENRVRANFSKSQGGERELSITIENKQQRHNTIKPKMVSPQS